VVGWYCLRFAEVWLRYMFAVMFSGKFFSDFVCCRVC